MGVLAVADAERQQTTAQETKDNVQPATDARSPHSPANTDAQTEQPRLTADLERNLSNDISVTLRTIDRLFLGAKIDMNVIAH